MVHVLALVSFVALYALAIFRWSRDFQRTIEPWLRKRVGAMLGVEVELAASSERSRGREWSARGASRRQSASLGALQVLLVMIVVFLPVVCVGLAARFHAIPWTLAYPLALMSLVVSCIAWIVPQGVEEKN